MANRRWNFNATAPRAGGNLPGIPDGFHKVTVVKCEDAKIKDGETAANGFWVVVRPAASSGLDVTKFESRTYFGYADDRGDSMAVLLAAANAKGLPWTTAAMQAQEMDVDPTTFITPGLELMAETRVQSRPDKNDPKKKYDELFIHFDPAEWTKKKAEFDAAKAPVGVPLGAGTTGLPTTPGAGIATVQQTVGSLPGTTTIAAAPAALPGLG